MSLPRLLPEPGPVLTYIERLPAREYRDTLNTVRAMLQTSDGRLLIDLLEKATTYRHVPIKGDARALDALNAQSLMASDLRRIAHETEYVDARPKDHSEGDGGTGKRRGSE